MLRFLSGSGLSAGLKMGVALQHTSRVSYPRKTGMRAICTSYPDTDLGVFRGLVTTKGSRPTISANLESWENAQQQILSSSVKGSKMLKF